jgi:hypothetical protein
MSHGATVIECQKRLLQQQHRVPLQMAGSWLMNKPWILSFPKIEVDGLFQDD